MKGATTIHLGAELRAASLRRTPLRIEVLSILKTAKNAMSVQEIRGSLRLKADNCTVHRTLNTFTTKRLVHRVRSDERSWHYAIASHADEGSHSHPHFVCEVCGTVECLSSIEHRAVDEARFAAVEGYVISRVEQTLHGRCPRCR